MSKKLLALLLIVLLSLSALTACKSAEDNGDAAASVSSNASGAQSAEEKKDDASEEADAKTDASNADNTDNTAEGATNKDGSADENGGSAAQQQSSQTGGWSKQSDGTLEKGDVQANVVNYGNASVNEGEELITQLVEGGMTGAKVLSKDKDSNKVVYTVRGTRTGADHEEFVKFFYTVDLEKGYLVTVIAQKESGLNTDISYILEHLKELAI